MHKVEFELVARDGTWKAEIFQRANGTFGFRPYRWSRAENCWLQVAANGGGRGILHTFSGRR